MIKSTSPDLYGIAQQVLADTNRLAEGLLELKAEMQAFRGHMISLQTDDHNIYAILARHDTRLDRIERRLNLVEPAL
jgi:hypothetical protein